MHGVVYIYVAVCLCLHSQCELKQGVASLTNTHTTQKLLIQATLALDPLNKSICAYTARTPARVH